MFRLQQSVHQLTNPDAHITTRWEWQMLQSSSETRGRREPLRINRPSRKYWRISSASMSWRQQPLAACPSGTRPTHGTYNTTLVAVVQHQILLWCVPFVEDAAIASRLIEQSASGNEKMLATNRRNMHKRCCVARRICDMFRMHPLICKRHIREYWTLCAQIRRSH